MVKEVSRFKAEGMFVNATYKTSNLKKQVENQPTAKHALDWVEYKNLYNENGLNSFLKL